MIRVETQDSVKSKDPTRSCALRKRDSRVSIGSAQALSAAHVMQQREAGFRRDGTATRLSPRLLASTNGRLLSRRGIIILPHLIGRGGTSLSLLLSPTRPLVNCSGKRVDRGSRVTHVTAPTPWDGF